MTRLIISATAGGRSQRIVVFALVFIPLTALAMLPLWFYPELGRLGYAYPVAAKYGLVVPWSAMLAAEVILGAHLLRGRGVTAIAYGFVRRGRPYVGTFASAWLCPWRRIRIDAGVRVQYERPRQPQGTVQYHRVVVTSGQQRLVLWAIAPPSPESAAVVDQWLDAHGITRRVVNLPGPAPDSPV